MTRRARLIAVLCAAMAAGPALAQPPADEPEDAIDQLLREVDPEAPEIEPEATPARPQPYTPPPRPILTEPVFIHETHKTPEGPPTPTDQAYDSRLRSSAAAVRSYQGPMEGAWTLSAGGREAYVLQLIDRGGWVDGAWRDLRRPGALEGSGFIEGVPRTSGDLTFRLSEQVWATLRPADGRWTGQLTEAGRSEAATLVRRRSP